MPRRSQPDLFEDTHPPARIATGLVAVPRGPTPLTREQKTFNRLAGRVQRLREDLRRWQNYGTRYHQRVGKEIEPAEAGLRTAQRRLVLRLDALLNASARAERLSHAHQDAVREHIVLIAGEILGAGPDPEIEALHDAYADSTHAQHAQSEVEDLEATLAMLFGEEAMAGHEARNVEELLQHAREHAGAQARAEAEALHREGRAGREGQGKEKGPSRAEQAAAHKARARDEALGTVRAIYRKLASAVHPDREPDADLRAHKTVLMQRANEAYERNDVLTLLELQMELEQIDAEHLASAPPERLHHFITVMKEQADALNAELESDIVFFRMLLDRPAGKLSPSMVDRHLDHRLAEMRAVTQSIEDDLRHLEHPRQRREILDSLLMESQGPPFLDDDPFALIDALMEAMPPAGPRSAQRGAKKKKKKRKRRSSKR